MSVIVLGTAGAPAHAASVVATPMVSGLGLPLAFTFAPDGRLFFADQTTHRVGIYDPSTGVTSTFKTLPASTTLFGIELHQDYPAKPWVYLFGKRRVSGKNLDQVFRIKDVGGTGGAPQVLFSLPHGTDHHGGLMKFGPDRMLYVSVGDEGNPALSPKKGNPAGKILRMTPSGGVPGSNPFGTRILAFGLRNVFGFDFDPATDHLWVSDNGPECNDEIDPIVVGGNYGWGPNETCLTPPDPPANTNQDGPAPRLPAWWWATTIGPTGAAFCDGCGLGSTFEGSLLVGDYNNGVLHALAFNPARDAIVGDTVAYDHPKGIIAVESAPDGTIWISDFGSISRLDLV